MELIALLIMSALLPVLTITAFVVGYNVNAEKKILQPKKKPKKAELTEEEKILDKIDKATVY